MWGILMKQIVYVLLLVLGCAFGVAAQPNIILVMTDDQGWGDVGYNEHPILKTPHLDAMAEQGVVFTRFYAQAPVCSPTRASCLTGRHPYRIGIPFANAGRMLEAELTLAELLRARGYRTGHFGKWHLGTVTRELTESNRGGPRGVAHYAPPWEHGFEVCFSTEAKVPTWDPMKTPGNPDKPYGTHYWTGPETMATDNLEEANPRVIMDRAVPFIASSARAGRPFFAVIWFHTPHLPVVAGPAYRGMYAGQAGLRPDYYGCLTAMDEQVGRLRATLSELGVAENTMLWFCSDNGPEGRAESDRAPGSTNGLRGRKRSLYEGGVRVPGLLVWPNGVPEPRRIDMPATTSDYLPTILEVLGIEQIDSRGPIDGVSLLPILQGKADRRGRAIGFASQNQRAWIGERYKIYRNGRGAWQLYDLVADPAESEDLAAEKPEIVQAMGADFAAWFEAVEAEMP